MIDQSIFVIVTNERLDKVVNQIANFSTFIKQSQPKELNTTFDADLWMYVSSEKFYFTLYAQQMSNKDVILDFDCIDRKFVEYLIDHTPLILQFFISSIKKAIGAYLVVNPPDFALDVFYNRIIREDNSVEVAFYKEATKLD